MDYEITKSEATAALRRVVFFLPSAADGFTPVTGKVDANFTCRVSKNGGDTLHAGAFSEIDAANQPGMYHYEATAGEVDTGGWLLLYISCANCVTQKVVVRIGASNADIDAKTTNLPTDPADQSAVEAAITAAEGNIRGADSDDLKALSDEIGAVPTAAETDTQLSGTHGSGTWEDKAGPGEGANVVTVTVEDDVSSNPIPAVQLQVRNSDESVLLATQETDVNGQIGLLLDDGTYKVRLRKLGSYTFTNPQTLVVSGTTAQTYEGTAFSPSTSPSPETCVVSGYTHDIGDLPTSVEVVADLVEPRHFTTGGVQIIKGAKTVSSAALDGYWELVLTRSGEYTAPTVRYSFKINGIAMAEYVIPDQANVDFADLPENQP